jgi:hypothetical protein
VTQALEQAGIDKPDFVLVFASVGYNQQLLIDSIRESTGRAPLCGCSGEGVVGPSLADESNFVVGVMVVKSDEVRMVCGHAHGVKAAPHEVGRAVAAELAPHVREDCSALLMFSDGLTCNYDRLMAGLYEGLPAAQALPILGGLAGENFRMLQTYQYCNDSVLSDGVCWALLSGSLRLISVVNHGSVPIGSERTITRCAGNVIYEIDGKPTLDVFREYVNEADFADWGKVIVPLALGFPAPLHFGSEMQLILRFVPGKDDATRSVSIPTEVSEGQLVWMTRRDADEVRNGLQHARDVIVAQLAGQQPKFVLQFDCGGRGKMLLHEEQKLALLSELQQGVAPTAPWLGFYTYGEFGPVNQVNSFHNYTVVLAVFY